MGSLNKVKNSTQEVTPTKSRERLEQICSNVQGKNIFQLEIANVALQTTSQEKLLHFLDQNSKRLARFYCSFICPNRLNCDIARENYDVDPIDEAHTYLNIKVIPFSQGEDKKYSFK